MLTCGPVVQDLAHLGHFQGMDTCILCMDTQSTAFLACTKPSSATLLTRHAVITSIYSFLIQALPNHQHPPAFCCSHSRGWLGLKVQIKRRSAVLNQMLPNPLFKN